MSEAVTPTPVYFHNCRMLGPQTRVPKQKEQAPP